jgi:hypothetical protein
MKEPFKRLFVFVGLQKIGQIDISKTGQIIFYLGRAAFSVLNFFPYMKSL